jgi:hypothetical protein
MKHEMMYTKRVLDEAQGFIKDARKDIAAGFLEAADMQLSYIEGILGQVVREQLDLDASDIFFRGRMQGIDDLDERLHTVFSSPQEQIEAGECNLKP